MADQYVTCRHCGIGINYQCDCDDDAAEERGREEVWGKVLDVLRMVYGKDMPYNESPAELIADLVPPAPVAPARDEVREAAERLREVASAGVEFDDERLDYVTVQIDREAWNAVRALAARGGE